MAELVCRWCKNSNVKALGENTQCFDCGRIAESLTYAEPEPEPEVEADQTPEEVEADQTPEEAEEAAALAAEIEAEEKAAAEKAAAAEKKPIPGLTTTASLNAPKPGPKAKS